MLRCWIVCALVLIADGQVIQDLREAARLDQAGRCEESERIYQKALAQAVPGPSLLNNAGNHYLACGSPEKARVYFERLIKTVPGHANGTLQLARIEMTSGAFGRAEELLGRLVAARPGDFDVVFLLGQAAARAGHLPRAKETLEAALQLRPDDTAVMLEAGLANASSGDYSRAVFLLARAQGKAPDQPGIALALARASEDAGYYGDAVIGYDRYLALRPNDAAAQRDRARALALTITGRDRGAKELAEYVERNPRDALGHFYAAQIGWREDADGSLARLAEAVRLDPRLAPAHIARAWLLHRVGRDEEALPHLQAALKITPNEVRALDQMGVVLLALDRARDAEAFLRKAAAIAPKDSEIALHLGRALMDQGREKEGQQWLDSYQKLRPARQRDARRESGMIELATLDPAGRRAREIERFRSMARSRPDDPLLQLHLAGLLLADGQRTEALREYDVLAGLNGDAQIWVRAGRALLDAGEMGRARPFLERAAAELDTTERLLLQAYIDGNASALVAGFAQSTPRPAVARAAALLMAQHEHYREALALLRRAGAAAPADEELRFTEALVLTLSGDTAGAARRNRGLEARWPDWTAAGCATLREWLWGTCRK